MTPQVFADNSHNKNDDHSHRTSHALEVIREIERQHSKLLDSARISSEEAQTARLNAARIRNLYLATDCASSSSNCSNAITSVTNTRADSEYSGYNFQICKRTHAEEVLLLTVQLEELNKNYENEKEQVLGLQEELEKERTKSVQLQEALDIMCSMEASNDKNASDPAAKEEEEKKDRLIECMQSELEDMKNQLSFTEQKAMHAEQDAAEAMVLVETCVVEKEKIEMELHAAWEELNLLSDRVPSSHGNNNNTGDLLDEHPKNDEIGTEPIFGSNVIDDDDEVASESTNPSDINLNSTGLEGVEPEVSQAIPSPILMPPPPPRQPQEATASNFKIPPSPRPPQEATASNFKIPPPPPQNQVVSQTIDPSQNFQSVDDSFSNLPNRPPDFDRQITNDSVVGHSFLEDESVCNIYSHGVISPPTSPIQQRRIWTTEKENSKSVSSLPTPMSALSQASTWSEYVNLQNDANKRSTNQPSQSMVNSGRNLLKKFKRVVPQDIKIEHQHSNFSNIDR